MTEPPRAVLVTGASTGIGAACVELLHATGFRVFGSVRREDDARSLRRRGIAPLVFDVTDSAAVHRAREEVETALGAQPLFGLVNNAGIAVAGPLEHVALDDLRHQLEVNVVGAAAVTQAFLPSLRRARGRVVMMSSISGRLAAPFMSPYAASKFALEGLSDSLRRELAWHGVQVTVVQPGATDTPIWDKALAHDHGELRPTVYGPAVGGFRHRVEAFARSAIPAPWVARAVRRALVAPRAPTRLLVTGRQGILVRLLGHLPDRWVDRLLGVRTRSHFRP